MPLARVIAGSSTFMSKVGKQVGEGVTQVAAPYKQFFAFKEVYKIRPARTP